MIRCSQKSSWVCKLLCLPWFDDFSIRLNMLLDAITSSLVEYISGMFYLFVYVCLFVNMYLCIITVLCVIHGSAINWCSVMLGWRSVVWGICYGCMLCYMLLCYMLCYMLYGRLCYISLYSSPFVSCCSQHTSNYIRKAKVVFLCIVAVFYWPHGIYSMAMNV